MAFGATFRVRKWGRFRKLCENKLPFVWPLAIGHWPLAVGGCWDRK